MSWCRRMSSFSSSSSRWRVRIKRVNRMVRRMIMMIWCNWMNKLRSRILNWRSWKVFRYHDVRIDWEFQIVVLSYEWWEVGDGRREWEAAGWEWIVQGYILGTIVDSWFSKISIYLGLTQTSYKKVRRRMVSREMKMKRDIKNKVYQFKHPI